MPLPKWWNQSLSQRLKTSRRQTTSPVPNHPSKNPSLNLDLLHLPCLTKNPIPPAIQCTQYKVFTLSPPPLLRPPQPKPSSMAQQQIKKSPSSSSQGKQDQDRKARGLSFLSPQPIHRSHLHHPIQISLSPQSLFQHPSRLSQTWNDDVSLSKQDLGARHHREIETTRTSITNLGGRGFVLPQHLPSQPSTEASPLPFHPTAILVHRRPAETVFLTNSQDDQDRGNKGIAS